MKNFIHDHFPPRKWRKILFLMRLKLVLLLCSAGTLAASPSFSQQKTLDVSYNRVSLSSVLKDLKARTGYKILYYDEAIPDGATVTMSRKGVTVEEVLDEVVNKHGLSYTIDGEVIVISPRPDSGVQQQQTSVVSGTVFDSDKKPLPGVTVSVKNTTRGAVTAHDGRYTLAVRHNDILVFSFIGKKTVELTYTGQQVQDVNMEDETEEIEQVVVTGMFNRRLESETGSSVQFKGEQLREAGNQNVLRSLANLDPSFIIMESIEFGSDPNRMPEIQMRGQSSFPDLQGEYSGNPNQPLFILDGFEVGIAKIYDLDMNRVSTITILKDASAKAIYGSKAGNGVVVIETMRPARGQIRVSYSGTLDVEAPDLTGYNLMNAAEKLDYEKMCRLYGGIGTVEKPGGQNEMDAIYQQNLRNVIEGVDTYWLSQPLRTGTGQKHSLNLDGGDERILYGIGLSYNNLKGVMKGSDRSTFSGNMNFSYTYKNLIFRNTLEFTNNKAVNSPYGTFSDYTLLNSYWKPYDENGDPVELLGTFGGRKYYNPLYNASLNTKSTSSYEEVRNNFQMEWNVLSNLRLTGRFSFTSNTGESDAFYPASHTMFIEYGEEQSDRKGRYTKGESKSTSYQADFGVNFSKILGKHMIFANATWNMSSVAGKSHTYIAEGFGNDDLDDIAFAAKYLTGSTPAGYSNNQREVGVVGALNYSYDDRYLFDVSGRTSGSSMYGANQKWGLFWSLGVGWNIHKEAFAQSAAWLNRFKIRGSVGYTGSQNFDPFQAKARYEYAKDVYDSGYGAILLGLPNDKLRWQRVLDYNAGADIALWDRVTLKFDYFITVTDDLLLDVAIPPSSGFLTYKENLGKVENKGFDATLALQLWRNPRQRGWFTLSFSAMHNKNKIKQISNTFELRNKEQNDKMDPKVTDLTNLDVLRQNYTRPSTLYYEGQSMTAIWGARSAGVDPMTGEELFYDLDGNIVNTWSSLNQVIIGDTSPKLRGNINLNAGWRGFTVAVSCSYRFGGELYNTTLVDKLENTDGYTNLDRRIYQAWSEPGQKAPYRKLDISPNGYRMQPTKPTSRFVMKNNELYISSLNVGYDFQDMQALRNIGIERLKLSFYMNELFRFSSIEIERGTSYPFARNFSLSLQATF